MINVKFNVICMSCGDVITTSCEDVYGVCMVAKISGVWQAEWFANNETAKGYMDTGYLAGFSGLVDGKFYHIDENHKIIGECPEANIADMAKRHGIN